MSRKLKFRAWVGSENTKFINMPSHYEYDITLVNGKYADVESGWDIQGIYENVPVEQYTGIKDKNGKEIYEGDIIKSKRYNKYLEVCFGKHQIECCGCCYKSHQSVGFYLKIHDSNSIFADDNEWENLEVIGNIHENPELLEEKK